MIKDTELRKGNLLYVDKDIITEVTVIGEDYLGTTKTIGFINIELFSPIPLTPERLENIGFKSYNTISGRDWHMGDIILSEENGGYELFGSEWTIGKTFYYLHQLQNICLDLFDEELEIKL